MTGSSASRPYAPCEEKVSRPLTKDEEIITRSDVYDFPRQRCAILLFFSENGEPTSHDSFRFNFGFFLLFLGFPSIAWAGMPRVTLTLTDLAKMRLQSISFFLVGFFLAAFFIKILWNYLRKDWTFLPRLNFARALVVVGLWGLLFVLVLTMISGARELMTPGAWEKQGNTYRLARQPGAVNDDLEQRRRRQLEQLRDALLDYARTHDGQFPASITDPAIPTQLWKLPDTANMHYFYLGGKMSFPQGIPLVHEPEIYGAERFLLYSNGDIRKMDGEQLAKLLEEGEKMKRWIMKRWIKLLAGLAVLGVIGACLFPEALLGPFQFVGWLVIGWIAFMVDVFPKMTMDWAVLGTGIACLAGLGIGLHYLCTWFNGQILRSKYPGQIPEKRWQLRWTLGLLAVVILMFIAGIASVGLTHQSVWLANSPEPLFHFTGGGRFFAAKIQSKINLKQIGIGIRNHESNFKKMPPGTLFDSRGRALHGWQTMLLPFLGEEMTFKQINRDLPWNHHDNRPPFKRVIPTFINPAVGDDPTLEGYGLSHYSGNVYVWATAEPQTIKSSFPDGASNTLLAGDALANFKPWGQPLNWRDPGLGINTTPDGFGNPTYNGAQFLMADASVRFIKETVSPDVLKALAMPSGRTIIPNN